MKIAVRKAEEADCAAIIELFTEMLDYHGQRDPHFTRAPVGDEALTDAFIGRTKEDSSLLLVAEVDGQVIGYAHGVLRKHPPVFLHCDFGEVNEIAVTSTHRHRGIGQALVERLCEWFTSQGIMRIEARVATANEMSARFWRKLGFEPYLETVVMKMPEEAEDAATDQPHNR